MWEGIYLCVLRKYGIAKIETVRERERERDRDRDREINGKRQNDR